MDSLIRFDLMTDQIPSYKLDLNSSDKDTLELLNKISMESESIDIECQVNLISDETDIYADTMYQFDKFYSTEGIVDNIKSKGKRAFYTGMVVLKKGINFLFGFITNLFKSSINVKGVLKKTFEKAKKYDKEIDKLISKKFPDDFEIESKDYAKRSNASLSLLRTIIMMTQKAIDEASNIEEDDPILRGLKLAVSYSSIVLTFTDESANITPEKVQSEIKKCEGDVSKTSLIKLFKGWTSKIWKSIFVASANAKEKGTTSANKAAADLKFHFTGNVDSYIKMIEKRSEKLKNLSELYSEEPVSKTVGANQLFAYFKNQIRLFLNISYKNNWDYSKSVQKLEKIRVRTIKAMEKINIDPNDSKSQQTIQGSIAILTEMGKSLRDLTPIVKSLLNNISSDIDNLMTEIAKAASKAQKGI